MLLIIIIIIIIIASGQRILTKSYIAILSPLAMTASGFVLPYPDLIQGSSASLLNSILIGSAVFVNAIDSKVHQLLLTLVVSGHMVL